MAAPLAAVPPAAIQRIADEALPLEARLEAAVQWRSSGSDPTCGADLAGWLAVSLPAVAGVLRAGVAPRFEDDAGQKLRAALLAMLARLPQNEVARPYAAQVFEVCLDVLRTDNQENAIAAIKLVFDLLKAHKQAVEAPVAQLMETIVQAFKDAPAMVQQQLGPDALANPAGPPLAVATRGMQSLRLLQELPLPVMFMLQVFGRQAAPQLEPVVGAMCDVVRLAGPDPAAIPAPYTALAADLRAAQIKCLQFVGHIVRSKPQVVKTPLPALADAVLHLLKVCPDNVASRKELLVAVRHLTSSPVKEAMRAHLDALLDEDVMLGPPGGAARTGVGSDQLRPVAYHIVAETVHHARRALAPGQLSRCEHFLSLLVANSSLPTSIRNISVRVLMSLAESFLPIARSTSMDAADKVPVRALLTRMLSVLVSCTKLLQSQVQQLVADARAERATLDGQRRAISTRPSTTSRADTDAAAAPAPASGEGPGVAAGKPGARNATPYLSLLQALGEKERELLDAKQLLVIIISAIKPLIYISSNFAKTHQQAVATAAGGPGAVPLAALPPLPAGLPANFTEEELRLLSRLWLYSLRCLPLMWYDGEPKDACAKFVDGFSALDAKDFVEVVHPRLPGLFAALLEDPQLMLVVTFLVGGTMTTGAGPAAASPSGRLFGFHLLEHMLGGHMGGPGRLALLENMHSREGMAALKLIKLLLSALPAMPDLEGSVAPLLARTLSSLVQRIGACAHPAGYLQLLRSLFKAALHPQHKPRLIQAELEPHLPACLNLLTAMLDGPNPGELRPLLVELCLTLPLTLEQLPRYLPRLVRPLLVALTQGPEDIQTLGLRTLDVWIDGCSPDVLEAACSQCMAELMCTLWGMLRPTSTNALKVMFILGKLGGASRRWLLEPLRLDYKDNPEYGLRLILTFQPSLSFLTPLDKCMALAKASMLSPNSLNDGGPPGLPLGAGQHDLYYRQQALRFLQVSLAAVMNLRSAEEGDDGLAPLVPPPEANAPHPAAAQGDQVMTADRLLEVVLGSGPVPTVPPMTDKTEQGVKTKTQLLAERSVLVTLLTGVIAAAAEEKLGDTATPFARDVCRHFAMLFAAGAQPPPPAPSMYRPVPGGGSTMPQGLRELDTHLFLDALLDVLCDKAAHRARAALDGIHTFLDALLLLHSTRKALGAGPPGGTLAASNGSQAMDVDGTGDADKAPAMKAEPMDGVQGPEGAATAGEGGSQADSGAAKPTESVPGSSSAKPGADSSAGAKDMGSAPAAAVSLGLPPVLDVLYGRLLHCCCDDTWQARLAGVAAVRLLVYQPRLPPQYLQHWAPQTVRALLGVVRMLPEHCLVERGEVESTLASFIRKVLLGEQPDAHAVKEQVHQKEGQKDKDRGAAATAAAAIASQATSAEAGGLGAPPLGVTVTPGFTPPTPDSDVTLGLSDVLVTTILSPMSPTRMRSAAVVALHLVAAAVGTTPSALTAARMAGSSGQRDDIKDVASRRLLPLKGLAQAVGAAEALDFCCRLSPPVVQWGAPLASMLDDAMTVVDAEDGTLLEQLPRSRPPPQGLAPLKVACLRLICGVTQLSGFRDSELRVEDVPPGATSTLPGASSAQPTGAGGGSGGGAVSADGAVPASGGAGAADGASAQVGSGSDAGAGPQSDQVPAFKRRLTLLLLNALANPSAPIHEGAKAAVEALQSAQAKVSKATLQQGLRPLLQHLGDHKKLTIPMLQGLSRLLEMLSDWFSVSLGSKLLEHLQKWTVPEGPSHAPSAGGKNTGPPVWAPGEEATIAAHMLDLFHLLPRQAVQFMETHVDPPRMGLVSLTIELEERLGLLGLPVLMPRLAASPYRAALTRFLNKYPEEAAAYVLDPSRVCQERFLPRLLDILRGHTPATCPLMAALTQATDKLLPLLAMGCSPVGTAQPAGMTARPRAVVGLEAAPFNAVHLVAHLAKGSPTWLAGQPQLVEALRGRWHSPERAERLTVEASLPRAQLLEGRRIAKALLTVVATTRTNLGPLFDLFAGPGQGKSVVSFAFLDRFCAGLPKAWSDDEIRGLLAAFVDAYSSGRYTPDQLEHMMQVLLLPVVTQCLEAGRTGVLDAGIMGGIARHLLGLPGPGASKDEGGGSGGSGGSNGASLPDAAAPLPDGLQIEQLKLTTLLLTHVPHGFSGAHHKQLITWAWRHLKRDNPTVVSHALLTTAHYLHTNASPEHVVHQVFTTALRVTPAGQPEMKRPVVRAALGLLLPLLLEKRFVPQPGDVGPGAPAPREPRWVRLLKRLLEDAAPAGHAAHLWQQLLQQAAALYPYRAYFVQSMVHTAMKLGLQAGSSAGEVKRLSLDLISVLIGWEETASAAKASPADAGAEGGGAGADAPDSSIAPVPSTSTGNKRTRDGTSDGGTDQEAGGPAKLQRVDGGAVAAGPGATPAPEASSSANDGRASGGGSSAGAPPHGASDWRPNSALQDQVCGLLLRIVLYPNSASPPGTAAAVESKDGEESNLVQAAALALLHRAVAVWPRANLKTAHLERVLPSAMLAAAQAAPPPQQGQQGPSCVPAPPMLTTALAVLRALLDSGSPHMLRASHPQVCQLVDPCGQTKSWSCVQELVHIIKTVLAWRVPGPTPTPSGAPQQAAVAPATPAPEAPPAPPAEQPAVAAPDVVAAATGDDVVMASSQVPAAAGAGGLESRAGAPQAQGSQQTVQELAQPAMQPPPEVRTVVTALELLLRRQLTVAAAELTPDGAQAQSLPTNPQVLSQLCCALAILEGAGELLPPTMVLDLMPLLVRVLARATREVAGHAAAAAANHATQATRRAPAPPPSSLPDGPEYGSLGWALIHCMRVCAPRAMHTPEFKKTVLSSIVNLCVGQYAAYLDRAVIVDYMAIVGRWLTRPYPGQAGGLSVKEAVLLCQRLALLASQELAHLAALPANTVKPLPVLDTACVDLLRQLCTSPDVPKELRQEAFSKVERVFMQGLRSSNPATRREFFALYHAHVPRTLFDRLYFIICAHDWEYTAGHFWLKHALDLLLAVLKEDDDILLAFNSSQVAPLLPGTKRNIFQPVMVNGRPGVPPPQGPGAPAGTANAAAAPQPAPSNASAAAAPRQGAPPAAPGTVQQPDGMAPSVKPEPDAGAADGSPGGGTAGLAVKAEDAGTTAAPPEQDAAAAAASVSAAEAKPEPASLATARAGSAGGSSSGAAAPGQMDVDVPAPAAGDAPPPSVPPLVDGAKPRAGFALTVRKEAVPQEVLDLVARHAAFLDSSGMLRVRDMMAAAREYLHADTPMCYHLWVLMFPIVWATLEKNQQVQLAKPLITLLSKEWHRQQAILRPNIIQALLDGIAVCQPQPKIPPELIRYLGKTYNAWQIAIPLLESHCVMFPQDVRCFDALGQLYHLVNEEDMVAGLWRKRCASEVTRAALWQVQTGQLDAAEELLGSATRVVMLNNIQVPRGEAALWVEQWVAAGKSLAAWEGLAEYARAADQAELSTEAAWHLHDWGWLKESLSSGRVSLDEPGPALARCQLLLQEGNWEPSDRGINSACGAAIMRWWQLPDVGTAPQANMLMLFQQLVELRESMRLLSDLAAGAARVEAGGGNVGSTPWQDTRDIAATWRTRTPNDWEPLQHWQDLLAWRNHVYNQVIKAFSHLADVNPGLHQLGYRDKAWAVNRLGMVATAHSSPDTCLAVLNTMYGYNAMEVQEAFVKIREQARAYLDKPTDLMSGLNLLSTTNLDYFQPHHQAELYRLKGAILAGLKDADGAHTCYSTALQLCRSSGDTWVAWCRLCDQQWDASLASGAPQPPLLEYTVHCLLQAVRLGGAGGRALLPRLLCLLTFDNDASPAQLASTAAAANGGAGVGAAPPGWSNLVGSTFARSGGYDLPNWVWLAWLPQLLLSLSRPEAGVVRPLLAQLAGAAPQAVFYPLRVYLVAMREALARLHGEMRQRQGQLQAAHAAAQAAQAKYAAAQQAAGAAAAGDGAAMPPEGSEAAAAVAAARNAAAATSREAQNQSTVMQSLDNARQAEAAAFEAGRDINEVVHSAHCEVLMPLSQVLRSRWPSLSATLEVLVTELSGRFSPRQEERLLAVVAALLHRCYKLAFSSQAEVPPMMRKELAGVCKACFTTEAGSGGRGRRSPLAAALRERFVADMSPDSPRFPASLGELMDALKAWRARLLSELEDRMPGALRLEEEAPVLADMCLADVEMLGNYSALLGGGEPPPGLLGPLGGPASPGDPGVVMLEAVGASIAIVRRAGNAHRRLALHGSDGRTRHMILQQNVAWVQHLADERILQLLRGFNRLMSASPPARARNLAWYTPAMVPVHTSVRLLEEDPSFTSYGDSYDINCTRYGREADTPVLHFKKRCAVPSTGAIITDPAQVGPLRLAAYTEICEKLVTENVFSQYVYKTLPSCNHLWVFKKTFCVHSALSALLCHMLYLGGRAPPKILFAKDSGRVYQLELCTMYSDKGLLDRQEAVPARLTRNMFTFFTSFGVEGVYMPAAVNAAAAILHKTGNLGPLLALFFRDDITTWTSRRSTKALLATGLKPEVLKSLVSNNARKALERLRMLAPAPATTEDILAGLMGGPPRVSIAAGVAKLVEAATDPSALSRMDPTWHPWF